MNLYPFEVEGLINGTLSYIHRPPDTVIDVAVGQVLRCREDFFGGPQLQDTCYRYKCPCGLSNSQHQEEDWTPSYKMPDHLIRLEVKVLDLAIKPLDAIYTAEIKASGVYSSSHCGGCGERQWGNCVGCRHPWPDTPESVFRNRYRTLFNEATPNPSVLCLTVIGNTK